MTGSSAAVILSREQLQHEKDVSERLHSKPSLAEVIQGTADASGIEHELLCQGRRGAGLSDAKGIICYVATRRLGYSGEAVAKALGITRSGVCRGARRGEELLAEDSEWLKLVEKLVNKSTTSP